MIDVNAGNYSLDLLPVYWHEEDGDENEDDGADDRAEGVAHDE